MQNTYRNSFLHSNTSHQFFRKLPFIKTFVNRDMKNHILQKCKTQNFISGHDYGAIKIRTKRCIYLNYQYTVLIKINLNCTSDNEFHSYSLRLDTSKMRQDIVLSKKKAIGDSQPVFIVTEIGQNHQGNINIAKKLIDVAKKCGADCVKFQKTCLKEKFNKNALERVYINKNSWGKTYGEHKQYLEFNDEQFLELQKYAENNEILFTASAMDLNSLDFLHRINVPFIKIGSGDNNNRILLEKAGQKLIPLFISTGMQNFDAIKRIYSTVSEYHKNFCLLHCISSYPTPLEEINLKVITLFQNEFPDLHIGYSGHEIGFDPTLAAVAMGAKVIERHITLDKSQKGSDHSSSLEPNELNEMIYKIRLIEKALGCPIKKIQPSENACYQKLGKTIVAARDLRKGHILTASDLKIKVAEPKGIDGSHYTEIIGSTINRNLKEDESIFSKYLELN